MPKPSTFQKALAAVALLGKTAPTERQVGAVAEHMANHMTVANYIADLEPSEKSLATLRAMLVHEATRPDGQRDGVVYRILARHEKLNSAVRFAAMAEKLPSIASGLQRPA